VKTDKEFALDLLGWLERYTLRISILEHLLNQSEVKDWKARVATMSQNAGARGMLHQDFQVWRDAILDSPDITAAANGILDEMNRREPKA
jgi:hypothetical protein